MIRPNRFVYQMKLAYASGFTKSIAGRLFDKSHVLKIRGVLITSDLCDTSWNNSRSDKFLNAETPLNQNNGETF